ncbi:hypothetical protein RFF05_05575 [Bengtsoniella intestinalis]|uniref:hypothetical protein n=1 Tax=Bengtsoniella intestinalis TaxID=3073143 RepID=UPI00391F0B9F
MWQSYLDIKRDYADELVLFQMGDFFEAYHADAERLAEASNLLLAHRDVKGEGTVPMTALSIHRLEDIRDDLLSKGFDLVVAPLKNGERKTSLYHGRTEEPEEEFLDFNPDVLREMLQESAEESYASPFIQRVIANVEALAREEAQSELAPAPTITQGDIDQALLEWNGRPRGSKSR